MDASKKTLGQFFTRHPDVHASMLSLVTHVRGRALEPSAGEGHLVAVLEKGRPGLSIDAVEVDPRLSPTCATPIQIEDFFTFADGREGLYDVIFGNPPYVAWKEVEDNTRRTAAGVKQRYSDKANLYHLFIDRCVDLLAPGGELVFIVPKEWLYSTSASVLRAKLAEEGSVTHLVDCGEEKLFSDAAVPALLIFRFVRGVSEPTRYYASLADHLANKETPRVLRADGSRWMLLPGHVSSAIADWGRLGDALDVKVGLVTGCDQVFKIPSGVEVDETCVQVQVTTKRVGERFINANHIDAEEDLPASIRDYLLPHKATLLARRIARFDESNWWKYGAVRNAEVMASDRPRLYALAKTRHRNPFFTYPAKFFSGGVLGLFLKDGWSVVNPDDVAELLNSEFYREIFVGMFLTSADKVSFQPATLEDVPFPATPGQFAAALEDLGIQTRAAAAA